MATYEPPKKNTELIFYVGLVSQANGKILQVNPTIAAGDFKVSIDGGAFANPATLPAVTPAGGKSVKVTLSASEMNGDNIIFYGSDAAGDEWNDVLINIATVANQFNDLATPTNITAGTITTATNVTTVNGLAANVITAAATATDFGTEIATALWTDTTAGDFTVAASIGKSVMNGVALGTGLTINAYTGNTAQTGDSFARIGVAGAGLTNIDLPNQTMDITGNITGNLSGSVGSVTGAVGSVTGNVGGNVTGSVGSVVGAVGSVTGNVGGNVTGSVGSVVGAVGSVTGLTAANLDTTVSSRASAADLATVAGYLDTEVAAIKAKTDQLAFTVAGQVNSNTKSMNDAPVTGTGAAGDLWRGV